jgi:hypothetical protein
MTPTSDHGVGSAWKPHGHAVFRDDDSVGHVVVVPAHCPSGLHALTAASCDVRETTDPNARFGAILKISCAACGALPRADHSWSLTTGGQHAVSIEFDDEPYADLIEKIRDR